METFERSGWRAGLVIGGAHAILAGMILPLLGATHPLVRAGSLPSPGPFGSGMGGASTAIFILLHLLFGAIVGRAYVVLSPALEEPRAPLPGRRPPTALRRS